MKRVAVVMSALLLLGIGTFVIETWRKGDSYELCLRHSADVFQDGRQLDGARVFRGSNGHVVLTLPSRPSAPYIYWPEVGDVGDCNPHMFLNLVAFGFQKHTRDGQYPCAGVASRKSTRMWQLLQLRLRSIIAIGLHSLHPFTDLRFAGNWRNIAISLVEITAEVLCMPYFGNKAKPTMPNEKASKEKQ